MSELPQGKIIGYVTLDGLTGRNPFVTQAEKPYRYEGREYADPYRLPSHMDPMNESPRKLGWRCDACDATSTQTFTSKRARANDAKQHDCK